MLTGPAIQELSIRKEWVRLEDELEDALRNASGMYRVNYLVHLAICNYNQWKIDAGRSRLLEAYRYASSEHPKLPRPSLVGIALQCERYGLLARSLAALRWIRNLESDEPRRVMRTRLQEALNHSADKSRLKIVAVGQDCIPGDILNRWGFGRHVLEGPFSAGVFHGDSPILAIQDDFSAFMDSASLKLDNAAGGVLAATLPKYRIFFNHETGSFWLEKESRRLLNLYAARIANFREAIKSDKVLFMFSRTSRMKIETLWSLLQKIAPSPRNRLIVIDFIDSNDDLSLVLDDRVSIIKTSFPVQEPKYVWHQAASFNTPAGLEWERSLIARIQPIIRAMAE